MSTNWGKTRNRDGEGEIDISYDISKMVIENDSLFFKVMYQHKKDYKEWLDNLDNDVFTIYNAEDNVEKILYTAYYEKLKQLMLNVTKKYKSSNKLYGMVKDLREKLKKTKITVIE